MALLVSECLAASGIILIWVSVSLPGAMVSELQPRAMCGCVALQQTRSELMSIVSVTTESCMVAMGLISNLRPFWCLGPWYSLSHTFLSGCGDFQAPVKHHFWVPCSYHNWAMWRSTWPMLPPKFTWKPRICGLESEGLAAVRAIQIQLAYVAP